MKRSKVLAVLTAAAFCVALTACDVRPLVLDGDGMINENNNWNTGESDPIKPDNIVVQGTDTNTNPDSNTVNPDSNTVNPDNNVDKPDNGNNQDGPELSVDGETLYASFINDECSAKFNKFIGGKSSEYTLSEMIDAQADEEFSYYFYYDDSQTYEYSSKAYYSLIDCGNDGIKELALWVELTLTTSEGYDNIINEYYIIKNFDGVLKCVAKDSASYRTWIYLNEYGVFFGSGSGGAALFCTDVSFVNADGVWYFDYSCNSHMALAEPMVPIYEMPSYLHDMPGIYEEEFAYENEYTTNVYNFGKYPDYPQGLTYDENGNYDAASQKKYDEYEKECEIYYANNFSTFTDVYGNYAEPKGAVKKFLDDNSVPYYSVDEVKEIIAIHEEGMGLTETILNGEEAKWIGIE